MLQNHNYETVGQMLATMIVQGGERPCLFSQAVCSYLSKCLDGSKPTIDEVQDHAIRNDLRKVWYIFIGVLHDYRLLRRRKLVCKKKWKA